MGPEEVLKTEDRYPSLILDEDNAAILDTRIDNANCRNETIDDERNTLWQQILSRLLETGNNNKVSKMQKTSFEG